MHFTRHYLHVISRLMRTSKNPSFRHLNPFPFSKIEGVMEFLEMPFKVTILPMVNQALCIFRNSMISSRTVCGFSSSYFAVTMDLNNSLTTKDWKPSFSA